MKTGAIHEIIEDVSNGATLKIALERQAMTAGQFNRALAKDRESATLYIRAQEIRADLLADEVVTIADDDPDPQRARNRIDARKWLASKHYSKRYGERLDINVTAALDISAVLAEAQSRLRPIGDQSNIIDAQVIDITGNDATGAQECESVAAESIFD